MLRGLKMKQCSSCNQEKPQSEFYSHPAGADGLYAKCKQCKLQIGQAWYRDNKPKRRKQDLYYQYGLTPEQYDELVLAQDGVCAICHKICKSGKALSVDHDHTSGQVRGLLCTKCNTALGMLDDDRILLERALAYLDAAKDAACFLK